MGKVYSSLKETLQRGKANSMAIARVKSSHALTLNDEMDELERLVVDRLGKFKAAVKEGETLVAGELQDVGQVAENLKSQISALEARLKETQDSLERKDITSHKMEATLTAEIHRLQAVVKEKENILDTQADEVNDLKSKIDVLLKRTSEFESAIQQAKAEASREAERVAHVTESFRVRLTSMEAQLSQKQETVRAKELAIKEQEQTLSAKINELENQLRNKEQLLTERDGQVNDLKSKIDVLLKRTTEFESAIRQAKAEAASEAERADRVTESFTARITAMEAQLNQTQDTVRAKELAIQEQEQNLSAKIQELETQLKNKERLLTERDRQVNDLESQLQLKDVSSYFRQTEGSSAARLQDPGAPLKTEPEKPGTSQVKGATSNTTTAAAETLPPAFFKRMFSELTDFIGPFAGMIVRDHVKALGESLDKFPKARLTELFELVSQEILNEEMKIGFRKWVARTCKSVE